MEFGDSSFCIDELEDMLGAAVIPTYSELQGAPHKLAASPPVPQSLFRLRLDPELKEICRLSGLRKAGRKGEVLDRVVRAWRNDLPEVRSAVESVLNPRRPHHYGGGNSGVPGNSSIGVPDNSFLSTTSSGGGSSTYSHPAGFGTPPGGHDDPGMRCICAAPNIRFPQGNVLCSECGNTLHLGCLGLSPHVTPPPGFTCAACVVGWLLPFQPALKELLRPKVRMLPGATTSQLQPGWSGPTNSNWIEFECPAAAFDAGRRVELRCFLATMLGEPPTSRKLHRWPLRTVVFLNGGQQPVSQQPQAWDGHAYKDRGEDKPLVLPSSSLRVGTNRIYMTSYDAQAHVASVCLTESRSPAQLVEEVKREHTLLPSAAQKHMRATFGDPTDDDDVVAGAARISLLCPLSMMRIATPVRGATCRHLECFDLNAYLELASATPFPRWQCPLCSAPARPHQLRVDSWTSHVLETLLPELHEVEVQPEGSFAPVEERAAVGAGRKRKRSSTGAEAAAAASVEIGDALGSAIGSQESRASSVDSQATQVDDAKDEGGSSDARAADGSPAGENGNAATGHAAGASAADSGAASAAQPAAASHVVIEIDSGDDEDHPICLSSDEED